MLDFQAFAISALRLIVWLAILATIFVPLERMFDVHPQKVFRKGWFVDLIYYFLSSPVPALFMAAPLGLIVWAAHRCVPPGFHEAVAALPLWARLMMGLVVADTGYYWAHRLSHEIPFLWRFHAIHHSAEEIDFLVGTRAHPVDLVFGRLGSLAPLYVVGLGVPTAEASANLVPILVAIIGTIWGFFIHANLRWRFGPLEWLVSTPGFHHWHHTKTGPYNKNYASALPLLDWIFGTAHLPNRWPESYGIKDEMPSSFWGQLVYPLMLPDEPEPAASAPASIAEIEEEPEPQPAAPEPAALVG